VVKNLLEQEGHTILIIGEFLSQLEELSEVLHLITGKTHWREQLYQAFGMVSWGVGVVTGGQLRHRFA